MPLMAPTWDEVCDRQMCDQEEFSGTHTTISCPDPAKKIKADLIEKAKVKKRYFKEVERHKGRTTGDAEPCLPQEQDQGKFAPEEGASDGLELLAMHRSSMRRRNEDANGSKQPSKREQVQREAARNAERESMKRIQGGFMHVDEPVSKEQQQQKQQQIGYDRLTDEERKEQRRKRQEKWHAESGSNTGRSRGQPNLGARMDLLLDKIKRG